MQGFALPVWLVHQGSVDPNRRRRPFLIRFIRALGEMASPESRISAPITTVAGTRAKGAPAPPAPPAPPALTPAASLHTPPSGPLIGGPGQDKYYTTRLRQLARLDLDESRARALWHEVARHRRELLLKLGRDVGQRVALLDYVVNVSPRVIEPQIIEKGTLEAIEHRAIVDPLTGLFNREYFDAQLPHEIERSNRSGASSSLLLMDLDRFKDVNDRHGHLKGDEVLRDVSAIVRQHVRAADIPCRYGGDELAAILTDVDAEDAFIIAERIRSAVEAKFAGLDVHVTVSIGMAMLSGPSTEDPFACADRALYEAKDAGGNKIVNRS